ncbi:MAG: lipid IV(A) 3-deoxy-D-manno-octulosonic acid transferase [Desulfohalobiaceae bacterium]
MRRLERSPETEHRKQNVVVATDDRQQFKRYNLSMLLSPRITHTAYSTLINCLSPAIFTRLFLKGMRSPGYKRRWGERLGRPPFQPLQQCIWIHAVSTGEAQAALALVRELVQLYPGREILVTTMTPAGSHLLREHLSNGIRHCYIPYDLRPSVSRFLDTVRPELAVVMETEIWPNIFRECARRDIPVVLANARLSPGSYRRYRYVRGFMRNLLEPATVLAKSESDAERFLDLGALPERTRVCGNIKFDITIPNDCKKQGKSLRQHLCGTGDLVWCGGSTHQGEEEHLLRAHSALLQHRPGAVLFLVPRNPERFEHVARLCRKRGFSLHRRSEGLYPSKDCSVYLADSMGELPLYYAASDLAFVGGSLVPIGGHNLQEPAALGLPVLTGPHLFNCEDIAELLENNSGLLRLSRPEDLDEAVCRLADEPRTRTEMGQRALEVVRRNSGATRSILEHLKLRDTEDLADTQPEGRKEAPQPVDAP